MIKCHTSWDNLPQRKKFFVFLRPMARFIRTVIRSTMKGAMNVDPIKALIRAAIEAFPIDREKKEKLFQLLMNRGKKE